MLASEYWPVLIMLALGLILASVFTVAGILVGPKRRTKRKEMPFESGLPSKGLEGQRYDVKFYMTALIFLIFDVEVVFLYPWAVKFRELGWFGFIEVSIFIALLLMGLLYVWRKGALEWE